MRCAARGADCLRCAALHGARIVCDARDAMRGAGGAMPLAMGGFKVDGERDGFKEWVDGWV
jgi:hypothetical protein